MPANQQSSLLERTQMGLAFDPCDQNAERLKQLDLHLLAGLLRQYVEEVR